MRRRVLVDDVPVGEQRSTFRPAATRPSASHIAFNRPAATRFACAPRATGSTVDNSRWLVVPVRDEVRVLCVAGREGAAKYVADALNPNPAGDSPIRPIVVSEGDLADVELADFDCVFLCNVAQLTASEAERLARYAAGGGGVVFFLGDRVVPESYNASAATGKRLASLPPALGRLRSPNRNSASTRSNIAIRSSRRFAAASGPAC